MFILSQKSSLAFSLLRTSFKVNLYCPTLFLSSLETDDLFYVLNLFFLTHFLMSLSSPKMYSQLHILPSFLILSITEDLTNYLCERHPSRQCELSLYSHCFSKKTNRLYAHNLVLQSSYFICLAMLVLCSAYS